MDERKPKVKLVGTDGNAFAVIGACTKAAKRAGWDQGRISTIRSEMLSGDYDHVLQTAMKYFEVE